MIWAMEKLAPVTTIPVGIVVERRRTDNRWQPWTWLPVSVIAGAAPAEGWQVLREEEGRTQYLAATLSLELVRSETEGYRYNLSTDQPRLYVVMRRDDESAEHPLKPFIVTASPYEAEAYTVSGAEVVEGVVMPDSIVALVQAFIDQHHVETPFIKRDRRRADREAAERRGGHVPPDKRRA
jgi:hypothetical protein